MSARARAIDLRRPVVGDKVVALCDVLDMITKKTITSHAVTIALPDGSIVLTAEELAIFGDGDARQGAHEIRMMIANERDRTINEKPCPRTASASVRLATAADVEAIYQLLLLDVAENAEIIAVSNEDCIRETITQALAAPNVVGVIDGADGQPVAVIMLIAMRWWWSRSFYYQEIPLFVHPDHRKSTHARSLIAFQRWWVDEMTRAFGYRVYLLCGVLGTKKVRAKIALYRRMFRQVGAVFLYPWPFTKGT